MCWFLCSFKDEDHFLGPGDQEKKGIEGENIHHSSARMVLAWSICGHRSSREWQTSGSRHSQVGCQHTEGKVLHEEHGQKSSTEGSWEVDTAMP